MSPRCRWPISLVQSVIAGVIVLLTVMARGLFVDRGLAPRVDRRGPVRTGLVFLAATAATPRMTSID